MKTRICQNIAVSPEAEVSRGEKKRFAPKTLIKDQSQWSENHQGNTDDGQRAQRAVHMLPFQRCLPLLHEFKTFVLFEAGENIRVHVDGLQRFTQFLG